MRPRYLFKVVVPELIRGLRAGHLVLTHSQRINRYAAESIEADLKRGYCILCGDSITKETSPHICPEKT